MKHKVSWFGVFIAAMALWACFGAIPYILDLLGLISSDDVKRIAPFGGMFGAVDAFFSGFALIAVIISIQQQRESLEIQAEELKLARNEMKASAEAQQEIAEQHKKAISLEIIMPFMTEISSAEMRNALITLGKLNRVDNFDIEYGKLLEKRNSGNLNEEEDARLELIDSSRRRFVGLFHKMQRLYKTEVVDNQIVKVVLGPDHCYLLLSTVEPLEAQIRKNYSRETFEFCRSLYTSEELEEQGRYKK